MNILEFYKKNKIIPTLKVNNKKLNNIKKQRFNFYFKLGLLPENFKNKEVLEFCPGTAYNAYYLLKFAKIKNITLVDINPESIKQTQNTLKNFKNSTVHKKDIRKFKTAKKFDYIIIENALSCFFPKPDLIFKKMVKFLKPEGYIILTVQDDIALFSERLRYLHSKLILKDIKEKNNLNFMKKILSLEFKSHLKTLGNSTRSIEDWVTDNLLSKYLENKKFFSFLKLYKCLNNKLIIKNMSPNLNPADYEWYKKFDIKINNFKFYKNYNLQRINLIHYQEKFNVNHNLNVKTIIKLIINITNLINKFNAKSPYWLKDLQKIKKFLLILSHNFLKIKKNNKISLSLIEYLKVIENHLHNKSKYSNFINYKKFWGHGTNAICIASIK